MYPHDLIVRVISRIIRRSFRRSLSLWLLVVSLLWGCSRGWSVRDEQFVALYTEILLTREQFPDTAQANPKVRALLQERGLSEAEFRQAFANYAAKPDEFRAMLDSARARARSIAEQERTKREQSAKPADSALPARP